MSEQGNTITSENRLKKLIELTEDVRKKAINPAPITLNPKTIKSWSDVIKAWGFPSLFTQYILSNPLYHIFCGEYCSSIPDDKMELVKEIEAAILYDEEALYYWTQNDKFIIALRRIYYRIMGGPNTLHPTKYTRFQFYQGLIRIFDGKKLSETGYKNIEKTLKTFSLDRLPVYKAEKEKFKDMIGTIIPESHGWDDHDFYNNTTVCNAINNKYDLNITSAARYTEPLFILMRYHAGLKVYPTEIQEIITADISYDSANIILGEHTDSVIYDMFFNNIDFVKKHYDISSVRKNWMYKTMYTWLENKEHPLYDKVKTFIFNLEILPW